MSGFSVCMVTAPSMAEAREIGRSLLEERLVACINLLPSVSSMYWWEGQIEEADEVLMVLKTRTQLLDRLVGRVRELHPYSVPEVLSWPLGPGNPEYLDWLASEATGSRIS
jgi:periplasmic divalent cation tolerance protein